MHAHDMRNAEECKNLRVLVMGTSYSAEDIGSMVWKNGASKVVFTWRTA